MWLQEHMNEVKSAGVGAGLVAANILIMAGLARTPAAQLVDLLFEYLIVGVIIYGIVLTGGEYLARNGILENDRAKTAAGIGLLFAGYGSFGGAILSLVPASAYTVVVGAALGISLLLTVIIALYVAYTGDNAEDWRRYSSYAFGGTLLFALLGTFIPALSIIAFLFALTGFLLLLGYEIWETRTQPDRIWLNGLGLYIAFTGVFVHILRLVVEYYLRR